MEFCFTDLLAAVSEALDCVERELIGVETNHGKRVACICAYMGKKKGLSDKELSDLAGYALLHDNALTEYIQSEYRKPERDEGRALSLHCSFGERNVKDFPFFYPVEHAILYHHENADGSGPFGKKEDEIPEYAKWIHLADQLDAACGLRSITPEKYEKACNYVKRNQGTLFGTAESELFFESLDFEKFEAMKGGLSDQRIKELMPQFREEYAPERIMNIAALFAKIVDYKSTFTSMHSIGIAQKAYQMGKYYGYKEEKCAKLYLAGALHDIGKLSIDVKILEKPGKLTKEEYQEIQRHASATYEILSKIGGFEEITSWAALHHEKLNGSGYPFGYTQEKLGREERLMAVLDIYQALSEERPYKPTKSHAEVMGIIYDMVKRRELDAELAADVDLAFEH